MCTLRVYWLVNLRSQPMMRQGNRLLASLSGREGEMSLDFGRFFSSTLEQEGVEKCDNGDFGEWLGRRVGEDVVDDGNSCGSDVE